MQNTPKNMSESLKAFIGQPLAVWAMRYVYRGMVSQVGEDFITLTSPRAVEITGPANAPRPQTEDVIPSDVTISIGAIEQVCQPAWVWHEMPVERKVEKD